MSEKPDITERLRGMEFKVDPDDSMSVLEAADLIEKFRSSMLKIDGLLTNMQPHIANKPPEVRRFIDTYIDVALEIARGVK